MRLCKILHIVAQWQQILQHGKFFVTIKICEEESFLELPTHVPKLQELYKLQKI
jgi:hypothetical protein